MANRPDPKTEEAIEEQLRSTSCVSFDTYDTFTTFENELKAAVSPSSTAQSIARKSTSYRSPRDSDRYPNVKTLPRADGKLELQKDAARKNDAIKTPYRAPSDHKHRLDSPSSSWYVEGTDFQTNFVVPRNQDLRRRTALDQEGFFGPAEGEDLLPVSLRFQQSVDQQCRTPKRTPPEFQSRVPHTARKSCNIELRLDKILDQEGLLPGLQETRSHKYRDETTTSTPFDTKFKPMVSYKPLAHAHLQSRNVSSPAKPS